MNLSTADIFKNLSSNEKSNLIKLNEEQLKKVQKVVLSIADDIIKLCDENNINYHLTGGTALGAVRHRGFIPWDDDMDIDIEEKDYNRLIKLIREKFGDKYYIHYPYNKEGFSTFSTHIISKDTIFRGSNDPKREQCGVTFDIVVIQNTFNNKILRNIHGFISLALGFIASCRKFARYRKHYLEIAQGNKEATKVFKTKIFIGTLFSFLTLRRWNILFTKWNGICKNQNSKYVTVPGGRKHFFGELRERKGFCDYTLMDFEGRNWKVPKEYDKYLTQMYGDYMKIPDEEHREQHVVLEFKVD